MAITWDQIGSETFIRMDGPPQPAGPTITEITRAGVNGRAWRKLGTRGVSSQHQTVKDVGSESAAATKVATYKNMVSTVVDVIHHAQTYSSYFVEDVQIDRIQFTTGATGGTAGGPVLIYATWTLSKAST